MASTQNSKRARLAAGGHRLCMELTAKECCTAPAPGHVMAFAGALKHVLSRVYLAAGYIEMATFDDQA